MSLSPGKSRSWWWLVLWLLSIATTVGLTALLFEPIELQPNEAPWWVTPAFALLGVLLGTVITPVISNWTGSIESERRAARTKRDASEQAILDFLDLAERYVIHKWQRKDVEEAPLYAANTRVSIRCSVDATKAAQDVLDEAERFDTALLKRPGMRSQEDYWPMAKAFVKKYWALVNVLRSEADLPTLPKSITDRPIKPTEMNVAPSADTAVRLSRRTRSGMSMPSAERHTR